MGFVESVILYLAGINAATYGLFAWDKRNAIKRQWRIPEKTLLSLALLGGTPAAMFAQHRLRHKTRKQPFRAQLIFIAVLQVMLVIMLFIPQTREIILGLVTNILAS